MVKALLNTYRFETAFRPVRKQFGLIDCCCRKDLIETSTISGERKSVLVLNPTSCNILRMMTMTMMMRRTAASTIQARL